MTSNDISVQDIRALQRQLKQIDTGLRTQMVREAKAIGRQAESKIKSAIPVSTPLRVSNSRGRMSWDHQVNAKGRVLKANQTSVQFRTSTGGSSRTTSLVSVKVLAPVTVMADMAGRSGRFMDKGYKGTGFSRAYERNGVLMRHKLNGQGAGMVRKLGSGASRYAWPAIEADRPALEAEIRRILNKYADIVNRRM